MRVGLAHKEAVAPLVQGARTKGLGAVEVIAQSGDTARGHPLGVLVHPTLACPPFAVLFCLTVLRHEACGGQGDPLRASWAHAYRGHGALRGKGGALGGLTSETVLAMHRRGGRVLGTIESHQQLVMQHATGVQPAVWCKALKDLKISPSARTRPHRSTQGASLSVTGNRLGATAGARMVLPLGWLERALGIQNRRRLREKDAKGASGGILDVGTGVRPVLTMVGQLSDPSVQEALEIIEASGGCHGGLLSSLGRTT